MTEQFLDHPQIGPRGQQMGGETVPQRMRCGAVRQPQPDPQIAHPFPHHTGIETTAPHPAKQGAVVGEPLRADLHIGGQRRGHHRQHRNLAFPTALAPYPKTAQTGRIGAERGTIEGERLADAQAAAVEEQQQRVVAQQHPGGGGLPPRGIGQRQRLLRFQRPRQRPPRRRHAQCRERRIVDPVAAVEMAEEAAHRGQCPGRRAARQTTAVAPGEPGPEIRHPQGTQIGDSGRSTQMLGEKGEEGGEIALVGGDRAGGHALFVPQPAAVALDQGHQIGGDGGKQRPGLAFCHDAHHAKQPPVVNPRPGNSHRGLRSRPMSDVPVPVLVPVPVDAPFDYRWSLPDPPLPGSYVEVPFGARRLVGVVWDRPPARRSPPARLRAVERRIEMPPLPAPLRRLLEETARETLAPLGALLKLALSVPAAFTPEPQRLGYRLPAGEPPARPTAARRRVLEALEPGRILPAAEIARRAGVGAGVVRAMADAGLLEPAPLPEAAPPAPDPERTGHALSPAQEEAAARLRQLVRKARFATALLEGVPGSGKTEVYFEAVAEALRAGRRVLVLLPEIALSAQWLARFEARFGAPPAVWHSALTAVQRRRLWRRIAEGREPVVVGARSALFLPLAELGLVIVDEEQDASFKQDEGVIYDARPAALARARLESCPLLLVSATPSVETAYRAGAVPGFPPPQPPWQHLLLPARHAGAAPPEVHLVDLRRARPPPASWLSPALRRAIGECLEAGEQTLLFLNRRGYAPLTLCRACGHRLRCPNCSAWLVTHRLRRRLQCHHCGWNRPEPEHCPHCGTVDALVASGPGVERIAEEVGHLFPEARLRIVTSDTVRTAAQAIALVEAVTGGEIDILIGTQILAKGHHFPALTLVGVVDADLGLGGGDLRAAERTFQLLYQVAGRAGREQRPGRVLIQTHLPGHPVMQALARGDRTGFLESELTEREASGMPPFGRLAALVLAGRDAEQVRREARRLARCAPEVDGLTILGPAPAPLTLLRGRYRERFLIKAAPDLDLPTCLRQWLGGLRLPGSVRLRVDVDPQSFL